MTPSNTDTELEQQINQMIYGDWSDGLFAPGRITRFIARRDASHKEALLKAVGEDDRDYSHDNADEKSLTVLVAASTAANELRAELRQAIESIYRGTQQ